MGVGCIVFDGILQLTDGFIGKMLPWKSTLEKRA